ncbi:MAG: serine protease [Solirubrobacterales bacterium]|nr:serine protease [Solirubrobacterales bacterium]
MRFETVTGCHPQKLCAAILAVAATLAFWVASAEASPQASSSVINGQATSISKWPWQVAMAESPGHRPGVSPKKRQLCGGSIVAPTMVLTAAHCAIEIEKTKPEFFTVIAGRTDLNDTGKGVEVPIVDTYFPKTRSGIPRYLIQSDWDVALLELAEPLTQTPIKIAGPDEQSLLKPGRTAVTTGWGTINPSRPVRPKGLMMGRTNIQPPSVCHLLDFFIPFSAETQFCMGDSRGRASSCYGDSGGPTVIATDDGYRQIGAVSLGYGICDGTIPSIDTGVARPEVGAWIGSTVQDRAGVDPLGSGATADPVGRLCRVPNMGRVTRAKAIANLRKAGCRNIKVVLQPLPARKSQKRFAGKVSDMAAFPGWLWNPSVPFKLGIGVWKPRTPAR